jgi:hypothetical protein
MIAAEAVSRPNCERAAELRATARRSTSPVDAFAFYRLAEMAEEAVWTDSSTCDFRNWVEANQGTRRGLSPVELREANRVIDDWLGRNDLYKGVELKPQDSRSCAFTRPLAWRMDVARLP